MKNVISGEKIAFTHFEEEDFGMLTQYQWDNEFLRNISWDTFHPWNEETWKTFQGDSDSNERFLFAIRDRFSSEFLGWISLSDVQFKNRGAELGLAIVPASNRGKGYATDAVHTICEFAFYELGLHKIRLSVHSNNEAAIKVYENVGFQREGIDREGLFQDGKWLDVYNYGLLISDWKKIIRLDRKI